MEKRNKKNLNWKGRNKTVILFKWYNFVYRKPKTQQTNNNNNLLELRNEFSKLAGCRINILKSVAFLHMSNKLSEREIKEII